MSQWFTLRARLLLAPTLALLVLALLAAPAGATASVRTPSTAPTNLPAAAQQTLTAMERLRSYEISMDLTTPGAPAGQPHTHVNAIVVRHGSTLEWDMKMTLSQSPGHSETMESVITSTRICFRMTDTQAWRCGAAPSSLASITNYVNVNKTFGGQIQMTPIGHKVVQGIGCNGYHTTITVTPTPGATVTTRGTFWLDAATHWIVEEDVMTSTPNFKSSPAHPLPPIVNLATIVYSHYNDPKLAIPVLPPA